MASYLLLFINHNTRYKTY